MAEKSFYFPSSAGAYSTPTGDYRLKVYYDDTSASSTDMSLQIFSFDNLRIPVAASPADESNVLSQFGFKCHNKNNIVFSSGCLNENKKSVTYFILYKDGSEYWRGKLSWETTKYIDWNGSYYNKVYFKFNDGLLALSDYDLSDASYTDEITLTSLLDNIAGLIGLDYRLIGTYNIYEHVGLTRTFTELCITDLVDTEDCLSFLKRFSWDMGFDFIQLDGYLNFMQKGTISSTSLVANDIIKFDKIQTVEKTEYVSVTAEHDWDEELLYQHTETNGTLSDDDDFNVLIDSDDILGKIFTVHPSGNEYEPGTPDTAIITSGIYVEYDPLSGTDFVNAAGDYIESGMYFVAFSSFPTGVTYRSFIMNVTSSIEFTILDASVNWGAYSGDDATVWRGGTDPNYKIYKVQKLVSIIADMLNTYYLESNRYKATVKGVKTPLAHYSYSSKHLVPALVNIDLVENSTSFEFIGF